MAKAKKNSQKKTSPSPFSFFKDVGHPLIVVDAKTGKVVFSNSSAEDLTGYELKDLKGHLFCKLFEKDANLQIQAALSLGKNKTSFSGFTEPNLILQKKSKRKVFVDLTANSYHLKGQYYVVFSIHDLSAIKRLQQERERATRELIHLSKLADIGRLAAGIAHELNNPLMIIQGFAENIEILANSSQIDLNELNIQLGEILKASDRMARMISKVSRIVRADDFQMLTVDLQEVAEDVLRLMNPQFVEFKIEIERDFPDQSVVNCDPNQIEQILVNILNNAFHAVCENPGPKKIRISSKLEGDQVVFSLWNNGPVIPEEIKEKIMSPFFTTKEVGKGTGLGLALSYGIMRAHSGDLSFSSGPEGTEFYLKFPKVAEVELVRPLEKRSILIVDDDLRALDILKRKLHHFGYHVVTAHNGLEGLEALKSNPKVVAVFSDLRMPKMDGKAFVTAVASSRKDLLIVGVSGYTHSRTSEWELRSAGVSEFLPKPIDMNHFSEIIKRIEIHCEKIKSSAA